MQQSFLNSSAKNIINNIKKEEEEENMKIRYYQYVKNKLEKEKEIEEERLKEERKKELGKYLDMQIEEKKKNIEFENKINKEQLRIFKMDDEKYKNDQINIQNIINRRNLNHLNYLKKQIEDKKNKQNENLMMNPTEYSMNYKILEKIGETLI